MPHLFSYGTLQQAEIQQSTFGRLLVGQHDALPRYEPSRYGPHANVTFNGNDGSRVPGTVYEVGDDELAAADRFEAPFDYHRITVTLASGRQAWVYVSISEHPPR